MLSTIDSVSIQDQFSLNSSVSANKQIIVELEFFFFFLLLLLLHTSWKSKEVAVNPKPPKPHKSWCQCEEQKSDMSLLLGHPLLSKSK